MKRLVEWRVRKSKRRKGTLSLEKATLDTLSLEKPLWKRTALIRKPYLWRNHPWIQYLWRNLFENERFSLETLSLEKSSLDTLSLEKPLWKRTVLIGNPIFGEIILEYSIFEETSLKTNSSHWKPYLWRKLPLKSGIPSQHQNKGTASRDSSHDAPLSTLWGTGGAARAAVPAYFPSASEYAYRQVCSPPRVLLHSRCR